MAVIDQIYQHLKLIQALSNATSAGIVGRDVTVPALAWRTLFSYPCAISLNAGWCSGLPAPCIRTVATSGKRP